MPHHHLLGTIEVQRAVEHIPGFSGNSEEQRVLDEFIMSHSQQTVDPQFEYDPINDCMKIVTPPKTSKVPSGSVQQKKTSAVSQPVKPSVIGSVKKGAGEIAQPCKQSKSTSTIKSGSTDQTQIRESLTAGNTNMCVGEKNNNTPIIGKSAILASPANQTPICSVLKLQLLCLIGDVKPQYKHQAIFSLAPTGTVPDAAQVDNLPASVTPTGKSHVANTTIKVTPDTPADKPPSTVKPAINPPATVTSVIMPPDYCPVPDSDLNAQLSCSFSEDEDTTDDNQTQNSNGNGDRPKYERVDNRIKEQKEKKWKGKGIGKGKSGWTKDTREGAIIPIHAPSMERMTMAKLNALKQRAINADANKPGTLVQEIMYDMDKAAEIRYSMAIVGAEFITESQMLPSSPPPTTKTVIPATNDPNTTRPRPPQVKYSREQKVLPFPKRRRQALTREKEARRYSRLSDSDSDNPLSDASWPTDKDEEIAAFSKRKSPKPRKKKNPSVKKPQTKPAARKPRASRKKKLTKATITAMVHRIRDPVVIQPSDHPQPNECLTENDLKKMVKAQRARIRQQTYKLKQAMKKQADQNGIGSSAGTLSQSAVATHLAGQLCVGQDVLAQAINISNIVDSDENEALDELLVGQSMDTTLNNYDHEALDELLAEMEDEIPQFNAPPTPVSQVHTSSNGYSSDSDNGSHSCTSSSNSGSSSSSETLYSHDKHEITDEVWGKDTRLIRNPFANTPAQQPVQAVKDSQEHQGYYTEQGLKFQKDCFAKLRKEAGLDPRSVLSVSLNRSDVKKYLAPPNASSNLHHNLTLNSSGPSSSSMSAKNISKDRSSSRGRQEGSKQDRFTKGREQAQPNDEEMDQDQATGQGANSGQGKGTGEQPKGSNKRSLEPPRTGNHDNTTTEDSDEEIPNAKRTAPSLREKLTQVYQKKTKETRSKLDGERSTPSVEFRIDASHAGEKVKSAAVPLLTPTSLADAPTLSLKDLVPEQDEHNLDGKGQPESFKTGRIEFVVVERELTLG